MTVNLSDLEIAVIRAIADGLQSKEIAVRVNRSKPTVEAYVRQLYVKFDARSRAHLVARAIANRVIEVPQ